MPDPNEQTQVAAEPRTPPRQQAKETSSKQMHGDAKTHTGAHFLSVHAGYKPNDFPYEKCLLGNIYAPETWREAQSWQK